ncbi:DinB family protein [Sphingobacterium sp. InxBP1]|uniref:DinB family protein n=1 Tax=Sphingobacterium sp. InxBP1 TaxID=2870328 RepID=UPI002244CFF3|nr:DinB family protein [Sphingobacterium sp. InxBP1]MCW8309963.1 DinB family protein [Sphingobacterium sp. InxBP1]
MKEVKPQSFVRWFDRQFDSNTSSEYFDEFLKRLEHFPTVLKKLLKSCPAEVSTRKMGGKWSVNENIGHLILLEDLWRIRFRDIKEGKPDMSPADLNNTATDQSSFNNMPVEELIKHLVSEREKTIAMLRKLSGEELLKTSMHPRLQQPMNIIDLMHFVAEHDLHHVYAIQSIMKH